MWFLMLHGNAQTICIGNDKHWKLWQTICSTPALFQAAHQLNQHPPCALGCPLTEAKAQNRAEAFVKCHWQPSIFSRKRKLFKVSVVEKPEAGVLCSVTTATHSWVGAAGWPPEKHHGASESSTTVTKAWPIFTPTTFGQQRWKNLMKCCEEAEMCPGEVINCVNNAPQRGSTQFLTAIWFLALFPALKLLFIHNSLCPSLQMSYTVDEFVCALSLLRCFMSSIKCELYRSPGLRTTSTV